MQELINKYFNKICSDKFLKNDDEAIIGKAKYVIENLKEQIEYVHNPKNEIDEEDIDFIVNEAIMLIEEINKTYPNKDDVIKISIHPMLGFYVLQRKDSLYEELKDYYEEMEDK